MIDKRVRASVLLILISGLGWLSRGCTSLGSPSSESQAPATADVAPVCDWVQDGAGPSGALSIQAQPIVTGLEVPWEVAQISDTEWLVTERPGRLRRMTLSGATWTVAPDPVLSVEVVGSGEGGLLGLALDPGFSSNRDFYLYMTVAGEQGGLVNRVVQYQLSSDHLSATSVRTWVDNVPGGSVHNGGRIHFGPDQKLYVSTGEATDAAAPRDPARPGGKILRVESDGSLTPFVLGLRNPQAFDWWNGGKMVVADNGPTGEYQGRTGGDKLLIGQQGSDMGWPTIWHCESQPGLVSPILTWTQAVPPGGLIVYRGDDIPEWKGNILIASTGAEHLHRVVLEASGSVSSHEVYLNGDAGIGRERTVFEGPHGELYVTTTNCDGRGTCPQQKDGIYRITKK